MSPPTPFPLEADERQTWRQYWEKQMRFWKETHHSHDRICQTWMIAKKIRKCNALLYLPGFHPWRRSSSKRTSPNFESSSSSFFIPPVRFSTSVGVRDYSRSPSGSQSVLAVHQQESSECPRFNSTRNPVPPKRGIKAAGGWNGAESFRFLAGDPHARTEGFWLNGQKGD